MKEKNDLFPRCIPEIEKIIGYTFRDKSLITQAFTRTSFCNEHGGGYQSNEVLEFIGDSVLSVAIITFLTEMHAERYEHGIKTVFGEGDFSNIKSRLSDKKNLSECITAIGLEKYLRLGEGDKKLGIEREPSVKEDLFESIIGATYIDCDRDIATVMRVVARMLDVSAYAAKTPPTQSSKNALQEFCADKKRKLPPPIYKTLGEEGPDHKKTYERGVYIGERLVASATGKNLKLADAGAAEAALKILVSEEKAKLNAESNTKKQTIVDNTPTERTSGAKAKATPKETAKATPKASAKVPAMPTKVEKETAKNATRVGVSSAASLKSHATRAKVATPTFKDLGEVREGGKSVYRVECIFMGKSFIGEGENRPNAKENAAAKMLNSVKESRATGRSKSVKKPKTAKKTAEKKAATAENGKKTAEAKNANKPAQNERQQGKGAANNTKHPRAKGKKSSKPH